MFVRLSSPLPGLHSGPISGLDSFRFSTITVGLLTIHCRLHSTALHCGLSIAGCFQMLRYPVRSRCGAGSGAARASKSDQTALLIKREPTTDACTSGLLGVGGFFGVVSRRRFVLVGPGLLAYRPWGLGSLALSGDGGGLVRHWKAGRRDSWHVALGVCDELLPHPCLRHAQQKEQVSAIMILKKLQRHDKTNRAGTCRAACTIDDLIDGRKRALSMTSSMDAPREGKV